MLAKLLERGGMFNLTAKDRLVSPNNRIVNSSFSTAPGTIGLIDKIIRMVTSQNVSPENVLVHSRIFKIEEK